MQYRQGTCKALAERIGPDDKPVAVVPCALDHGHYPETAHMLRTDIGIILDRWTDHDD